MSGQGIDVEVKGTQNPFVESAEAVAERATKAYKKVASVAGTVVWLLWHPWTVIYYFIWAWASTYWLGLTLVRRGALMVYHDWKGMLILGAVTWLGVRNVAVWAQQLNQDNMFHYVKQIPLGSRETFVHSVWNTTSELALARIRKGEFDWAQIAFDYFSVMTVLGWIRGCMYVWHWASQAKLVINPDVLSTAIQKPIYYFSRIGVLYRKDEKTGLLTKVYMSTCGNAIIVPLEDDETTTLDVLIGRKLEARMPFSEEEPLGAIKTHSGAFFQMVEGVPVKRIGGWFRVGKYILTCLHVQDAINTCSKLSVWTPAGGFAECDIKTWKVVRSGGDFVAYIPPPQFYTAMKVSSAKLATGDDSFVCVENTLDGLKNTVAWGKITNKWDSSQQSHSASTSEGCSGNPVLTKSGAVVGMHTGYVTEVLDGRKVVTNFMYPSSTIGLVLGLVRAVESPTPKERRRLRAMARGEWVERHVAPGENDEDYDDDENDQVVSVVTTEHETKYTRRSKAEWRADREASLQSGSKRDELKDYVAGNTGNFKRDMAGEAATPLAEAGEESPPQGGGAAPQAPGAEPGVTTQQLAAAAVKLAKAQKTWEKWAVSINTRVQALEFKTQAFHFVPQPAGGSQPSPASSGPVVTIQSLLSGSSSAPPPTPTSSGGSSEAQATPSGKPADQPKKKRKPRSPKSPSTSGQKGTAPPS